MKAVCIENFKMPEKCSECMFSRIREMYGKNQEGIWTIECKFIHREYMEVKNSLIRRPDCPLKEVEINA